LALYIDINNRMADTTVQQNKTKLVTAHARNLHISPRKMRLVTNLVQGMQVGNAITQLQFANKKASPMLIKLLKSAIANAEHNFSLSADNLVIKTITCDMGPVMKRYFPRARGSAFVIRRKTSHVHVTLEDQPGKAKKKAAQTPIDTKRKTADDKDKPKPVAPEVQKPRMADEAKPMNPDKSSEVSNQNLTQQKRRPQAK
jgi:large subunit ribosomal protein L22